MTLTNARPLIIATRQSPLALWQANFVKDQLEEAHPGLQVVLKTFITQGDKILDTPLAKIGGKGLFVKELEAALLGGRADLAVHSCKDLPMHLPEGLELSVIMKRHDPRDALVSNRFNALDELPNGAVVGTSSLRRRCQLLALRPDLKVKDLRGNVGTRLGKLDAGEFDAIILAASGLDRLELELRIAERIDTKTCLPAVAQGALGLEVRSQDAWVQTLIEPLNCQSTEVAVRAERAMNRDLEGGCQVPIAGYAQTQGDKVELTGRVLNADGTLVLEASASGQSCEAEAVGKSVAAALKAQGAERVLAEFYQ